MPPRQMSFFTRFLQILRSKRASCGSGARSTPCRAGGRRFHEAHPLRPRGLVADVAAVGNSSTEISFPCRIYRLCTGSALDGTAQVGIWLDG